MRGSIGWILIVLSDTGINWIDIDILSDTGINWNDIGVLSDSGDQLVEMLNVLSDAWDQLEWILM